MFPQARNLLVAREQRALMRSLYSTLALCGSTEPLSRRVGVALAGRFAASNRALQCYCPVALDQFGYER